MQQRGQDDQPDYGQPDYEPTRSRSGGQQPNWGTGQPQWAQPPGAGQQQPGQPGWQAPAAKPPKKNGSKVVGFGCLGVIAIVVVIVIAVAVSGNSGSNSAASSHGTTGPAANGGSYSTLDGLLTALSNAGVPCSGATPIAGSTITGSLDADDCNSPDNSSSETDSVVSIFDNHADAEAYAQKMLSLGTVIAGVSTQVVVGENWVVNTEPPYASDVAEKLGGQVQTVTGSAAPATSQAAPVVPDQVVFSCTGSAPDGVNITYGAEGTNDSGSSLPFRKTVSLDSSAQYYNVTAQLQGAGQVTCTTTVDSDGQSTAQTGNANGGYNIASAEVCSDFSGGWQDC